MTSPDAPSWGFRGRAWAVGCGLALLAVGCADGGGGGAAAPDAAAPDAAPPDGGGPDTASDAQAEPDLIIVGDDPSDQPLTGLAPAALDTFTAGDAIFDTSY